MTDQHKQPAIGPVEVKDEQRGSDGSWYHPTFFTPGLQWPTEEDYLEWYAARLIELNLECDGYFLGDGYPKMHEVEMHNRYMGSSDESERNLILRNWVPQMTPGGKTGSGDAGWFIQAIYHSDHGPHVMWSRIRNEAGQGDVL